VTGRDCEDRICGDYEILNDLGSCELCGQYQYPDQEQGRVCLVQICHSYEKLTTTGECVDCAYAAGLPTTKAECANARIVAAGSQHECFDKCISDSSCEGV
jgi:hypothetical protein